MTPVRHLVGTVPRCSVAKSPPRRRPKPSGPPRRPVSAWPGLLELLILNAPVDASGKMIDLPDREDPGRPRACPPRPAWTGSGSGGGAAEDCLTSCDASRTTSESEEPPCFAIGGLPRSRTRGQPSRGDPIEGNSCTPCTADGPARTSRRLSGQATGPDSPGSTGRSTAAATPTKPSTPTSTAASPATQKPPRTNPTPVLRTHRGAGRIAQRQAAAAISAAGLPRCTRRSPTVDGDVGRSVCGTRRVALADAARHRQSIYADFGVRHLSMGTGTGLDPSSIAAILRTLQAEDDPFLLLVESNQAPVSTRTGTNCGSRRVRRQPSRRGRPPGSVLRCPSRVRRIQFPGDIPGLPPARSSDRGERARSGGHRPRVDPYGPQRHEGTSGHGLARRTPQGWLRGRRGLDGVASRNGTRGRLRRIVSSWRAERAAWRAVLGLPPCTCSSRPVSWPGTPAHPTTPPPTWTRFGVCVAISRARCLGRG